MQLDKSVFDFLKKLKKNNGRDWFNAHKEAYVQQHEKMILFADSLLKEMNKHDHIETATGKKSLHRIYRDIRFSSDKTPYNTHFGGSFKRATAALRGGYYYHIEPGASFAGGGFWGPSPEDLKRIREDIALNGDELKAVLNSKKFKAGFGKLWGEALKTAPKGFDKEHPHMDLIKMKQFLISKSFTDEEVLAPDFHKKLSNTFKEMRPFFDYMSVALTTDGNGELL
ncbi:MAG: DUF2461 domain-containing protein [Bacteroidetes bacterium]|nr:DUF2461 domain-containing protein [Bacteroidota bacterium]